MCRHDRSDSRKYCVITLILWWHASALQFLPCCMECRCGLAMRTLSVRLSVKRVNCDKKEEKYVKIFTPYERPFSLVYWEKDWLVGTTLSTWNFESNWPRCSEIADFRSIFARTASAITSSEKSSIATNRKSTTHFPISPRWTTWLKNAKCPKFEQ